ncbi:MAG: RNA 2',3'-cyclic phosphodiesterase [Bryobacteraceae bacterium]
MRLFTGIDLPEDVQDKLERFLAHLRPTAHLIWSPVYNLHITTKFIGEWPEQDLEKLTSALRRIRGGPPIAIAIRDVGWFPSPHSPRVFWAGIHSGTALADLAKKTEDALEPLGIARERREFSPHLTLARLRLPVPLQVMQQAIAKFESLEFGSAEADRFHLYLSRPGSAGTVYTKLAEFKLAGA